MVWRTNEHIVSFLLYKIVSLFIVLQNFLIIGMMETDGCKKQQINLKNIFETS